MMKGYLDNPTNDIYVSFSGVPYPKFDVYVYFNDDNTSGGTVGSIIPSAAPKSSARIQARFLTALLQGPTGPMQATQMLWATT